MTEIRPLTSLRGLAALWVFFFHVRVLRPGSLPDFSTLFWAHGYLAVDLFFVLSGFVMALTYKESFDTRPLMTAYPEFLLKRVGRVVPLHAVIVLTIAVVALLFGNALSPGSPVLVMARDPAAVVSNVFLMQEWTRSGSIIPPGWSVSDEMGAYIAFPLLLWLAWGRMWPLALALAFSALFTMIRIGHGSLDAGFSSVNGIVRCFAEFFIGLLCYRAYRLRQRPQLTRALWVGVIPATAAYLLWCRNDIPAMFLFPIVIYLVAIDRGPFSTVLGAKPLHYLGQISYAIYLTHWGVIWGNGLLGVSPQWTASIAFVETILVSSAAFHLIEMPARRLMRRLSATGSASRQTVLDRV